MRKLLITTNMMFIGIIVFMSCNKSNLTTPNENETGGKVQLSKTSRDCPDCYNYTPIGFEGVNAATASMMSQNYKQLSQPLLAIDENNPDANCIWFSLESLKNFIWKIEDAVCKKGCTRSVKLGIRAYYGKYPTQMGGDLSDIDPAFAQRHTLFLVPTFQDSNDEQIHWDFDPWHWGDNGCKPKPMSEWFSISPKPFGDDNSLIFSIGEDQYFANGDGTLTNAMNHGDLIPPYPPIGTAY